MLYGFQGKNETRVISVSTTKSSLNAAILPMSWSAITPANPMPSGGVMPIGLALSGKIGAERRCSRPSIGKTKYPSQHRQDERYRRSLALIRNALSAQVDQNAIVVPAVPPPTWPPFWRSPATRR